MPWPYHQIPLAQLEEYKRLAFLQKRFGKAPGRDGDYSAINERLPREFIEQLPGTFALNKPVDPNRDVYFIEEGKVFRVEYNSACTDENPYCGRFDSLRVGEVISPEAVLGNRKEDFENPAGFAFESSLVGAWLWPTGMSYTWLNFPGMGVSSVRKSLKATGYSISSCYAREARRVMAA